MTKKQALALLTLIADLYSVINSPDAPPPDVEFDRSANGKSEQPQQSMTVE